jgi:hypothetical protein
VEKARLKVRITPRSSRNQIAVSRDGVLSLKLTAPPIEGAANKAAVELLADRLRVGKSRIALVSGAKSREKTFEIAGLSEQEIARRLSEIAD